jgi:predicted secreted protein
MHRVCRLALAAFVAAAPAMAETFVVQPDLALHGDRPFEAQVAAHPGDAIRVDLPALAGTGYSWAATVAGDAVQADGSEKREAVRPGGPTREILIFSAAAPGSARITLDYRRPWEASDRPARQVVVRVEVTEAPPVAPGLRLGQ